jgi:hypothetical protein
VDFKPLDFGFVMECSENKIRIFCNVAELFNYLCVVWFLLLCPFGFVYLHIMCFADLN